MTTVRATIPDALIRRYGRNGAMTNLRAIARGMITPTARRASLITAAKRGTFGIDPSGSSVLAFEFDLRLDQSAADDFVSGHRHRFCGGALNLPAGASGDEE
jgi:hypothetical protein